MPFVGRKGEDKCVAIIHKSGSTSIRAAVQYCKEPLSLTNEEAESITSRIMFVRDPLIRIRSGFSHFHHAIELGAEISMIASEAVYVEGRGVQEDYEAFIDHILTAEVNSHWQNQCEIPVNAAGEFIPNIIHKFEDIMSLWADYYQGGMPWYHGHTRIAVEDYREADLINFYEKDLELRRSL